MKYGHHIKAHITAYDKKGRGISDIETAPEIKRTAAIPFSAIGDTVEATFIRRDHRVRLCRLDNVITPGPNRIVPPCPHAGHCGGCIWQHISYTAQLKEKERAIQEAFKHLPVQKYIQPILPASQQFAYRNRMDFAVGWKGEIGLKEYGAWNRYVDLKNCTLMEKGAGEILQKIREWMQRNDLQPWDAKFHTGNIRYVVIRDGRRTKQRMILVIAADLSLISHHARKELVNEMQSLKEKPATSILLGEQPKITDISTAERTVALDGEPWITEEVNRLTYRIYPNTFFQTNTEMAEKLQQTVLNLIPKTHHTVLDLYCGSGFFGIAIAKKTSVQNVYGYELDKQAIACAQENATTNHVEEKCTFIAEKTENQGWKKIKADTVILDPPRAGLHPKTIKALLDPASDCKPQRIIYVSCNYHKLAEELPMFLESFNVEHMQPLDLFPQTRHAEIVTVLKRQL